MGCSFQFMLAIGDLQAEEYRDIANMNNELVSIIVPVYRAGLYIGETIASVIAQTWPDWELILVDDCSPDDTCDVIERVIAAQRPEIQNRIRLIRKPVNAGAAEARNTGVDAAAGRYIAFLDADDLWDPAKLDRERTYMHEQGAAFVFTSYRFGDEHAQPTGKAVHVPQTLTFRQALSRTVIFTSTVLFDTAQIPKERLHMPNIGSEDTALWWTLLRSGITAHGLDELLVTYRRPAGASLSSNKGVAIKRIWNLYRNVAGLSAPASLWCLAGWAVRATARRVLPDHK